MIAVRRLRELFITLSHSSTARCHSKKVVVTPTRAGRLVRSWYSTISGRKESFDCIMILLNKGERKSVKRAQSLNSDLKHCQ